MPSVSEGWGPRVRAAVELRGFSLDELAYELNLSRRTLDRTIRGERVPREWETTRIVDILSIPDWFIRDGLDGPSTRGLSAGALEVILAALERIEKVLTEMREHETRA